MKIEVEPEDLSRLEAFIEKCRYAYHTRTYYKFSNEEDKLAKRMAKQFRRELKDYHKSAQQNVINVIPLKSA